jgi:polysaccharide pyruvyl transferase WcaK-like protein
VSAPSARRLRIGLFGLFGVRNLGNEATLAAAVAGLRARAEVDFVLVSSPPAVAAGLPHFPAQIEPDLLPVMHRAWPGVPSRWKEGWGAFAQRATEPLRRRRTRVAARAFDMLLVPGTGIADDFGQGPYDAPHHMARWCGTVREQGGLVSFASIGAGPASHPLSRRWFGDALRAAHYRSYREPGSKAFATEIGVDTANDPVMPDMVFSLPHPDGVAPRAVSWPPRDIALGVMAYKGWNVDGPAADAIYAAYLQKITWLAGQLLDSGLRVRLLIGNRGSDVKTVRHLREALAAHPLAAGNALVAADIQTHDDVLREIGAADLVVASRFHNILKGVLLGRPAISIGYARKNDELMNAMGLAGYCHAIEQFDPAEVLAQIRQLSSLPQPPTAVIERRVTEYRSALATQFDRLIELARSHEG